MSNFIPPNSLDYKWLTKYNLLDKFNKETHLKEKLNQFKEIDSAKKKSIAKKKSKKEITATKTETPEFENVLASIEKLNESLNYTRDFVNTLHSRKLNKLYFYLNDVKIAQQNYILRIPKINEMIFIRYFEESEELEYLQEQFKGATSLLEFLHHNQFNPSKFPTFTFIVKDVIAAIVENSWGYEGVDESVEYKIILEPKLK